MQHPLFVDNEFPPDVSSIVSERNDISDES